MRVILFVYVNQERLRRCSSRKRINQQAATRFSMADLKQTDAYSISVCILRSLSSNALNSRKVCSFFCREDECGHLHVKEYTYRVHSVKLFAQRVKSSFIKH